MKKYATKQQKANALKKVGFEVVRKGKDFDYINQGTAPEKPVFDYLDAWEIDGNKIVCIEPGTGNVKQSFVFQE